MRSGPRVDYAAVSFAFPKNNSEASLIASCYLSDITVWKPLLSPVVPVKSK